MARATRYDISRLQPVKRHSDGRIRADAHLARIGVQEYHNPDGSVRRELRLPEDVFSPASLSSFAQVPVTDDHPPVMLDSRNARKYAVGALDGTVTRDGDHVRSTLGVFDAETIAKMEAGKLDVSMGYVCDLDETPGNHPVYGKYDAIQRNIIGNHAAIVDHGRAGTARARMDGAWSRVDNTLNAKEREQLKGASFAAPDEGLPIENPAHVQAAMSRFGEEDFPSPEAKKAGFHRILAAAKHFGMDPAGFKAKWEGRLDEWSEAAREASAEARKNGAAGSPDKAKDARVKTAAAMVMTSRAKTVQGHLQAAKAHEEAAKANHAAGNDKTADAHTRQAANHYKAAGSVAGRDIMTPAQEFANKRAAYVASHHDTDGEEPKLARLQEACQSTDTQMATLPEIVVKLDSDSLKALEILNQRVDAKGDDDDDEEADDEDDDDPDDAGDDANDPDDDDDREDDDADADADAPPAGKKKLPAFLQKKSAKKDRRSPHTMNDLKKAQEDLAAATARADQATKELDAARAEAASQKARADKAEDAIKTARKDAEDKFPGAVKARVALETQAISVLGATDKTGKPVDRSGLSDRDLRLAVIKHVDSIDIAKEESDDYVRAYYTSAFARAKKDAIETERGAAALAGARETVEANRNDAQKTDAADDDEIAAAKRARTRTTTAWQTTVAQEIK